MVMSLWPRFLAHLYICNNLHRFRETTQHYTSLKNSLPVVIILGHVTMEIFEMKFLSPLDDCLS